MAGFQDLRPFPAASGRGELVPSKREAEIDISTRSLAHLVGCNIHSADRVIAAYQDVSVGGDVRLAPEVALAVASVDARAALVLRGGVPMGNAPAPYDFSWAFVLRDEADGVTRLVVRERYRYLHGWARLIVEPVAVVSFLMTQKMLRGIRDRAEGTESPVNRPGIARKTRQVLQSAPGFR